MSSRKHPTPGLFFARHGQSTANRNEVSSGGDSDPELTALGREQARGLAHILLRQDRLPGLIISSPLKRTLTTAHIINEMLNIEIRIEESLIERALGDWNGQSSSITNRLLRAGHNPPNGESANRFHHRITNAFRGFSSQYEQWPLIIGSRGTARVMLEGTDYMPYRHMPNGALVFIKLSTADAFQIAGIDRLCHAP